MKSADKNSSPGEIVVVGPVLPYRGGISQYNTSLFRSLKNIGLSTMGISFSRQYPAVLYPGKSDIDVANATHEEEGILYSIDSLNPFSWWTTFRKIAEHRPKLVVFHWWTVFWAPCFSMIILLLRSRGLRVAFICHNLEDHDSGGIKAWLSRWTLSLADSYLVHSTEQADIMASTATGKQVVFHPIPAYGHYPAASGKLHKRGRLELLFFGFIRPYKGLDLLIEALKLLDDGEIYLTVVGEPWGDPDDLLASAEALGSNVEFHLDYTSDEDVAEYFDRADFAVLPYRKATGSAVAAVAQHYLKPLLATRVGGLCDVVVEGKTGILVEPNDIGALAEAIRTSTREHASALSLGIKELGLQWNWNSLARALHGMASHSAR
jgi:glycosyltransferase involved in cell wall biosynthesis